MKEQTEHKYPIFFWASLSTLFIFCYYLLALEKPLAVHFLPIIGLLFVLYHPRKGFYFSLAVKVFYLFLQKGPLEVWDVGHLGFLSLSLWIFSRLYTMTFIDKEKMDDPAPEKIDNTVEELNIALQKNNAEIETYRNLIEKLKGQNDTSATEMAQKCKEYETYISQLNERLCTEQETRQSLNSQMQRQIQALQAKATDQFEVVKKLEKEKHEYISNYSQFCQDRANYVQLKKQFQEKKNILEQTRKELFHLQTDRAALQQKLNSLMEEPSSETLDLIKFIEELQEEKGSLMQDNLALENLLTHFIEKKEDKQPLKKVMRTQMDFQW